MSTGHSVKAAFWSNLGITVMKGFAAFFTGSAGMIAEAIHSGADCFNQVLLMLGQSQSQKAADADHPYGYGMRSVILSFIVAIVLFSGGCVYAVLEGVHKLLHPMPLQYLQWNLAIFGVAAVLEGRAWLIAYKELGSPSARKMFKEVVECKDPSVVVVLVEDTGALIGLMLAFIVTLIAWYTGNPMWDAIGSIVIGVLLGFMSFFLGKEMIDMLTGESMDQLDVTAIRDILKAHPSVQFVGEIKTKQMGPDSGIVGVEVDFIDSLHDRDLDRIIPQLEKEIKEAVPEAEFIFIEPHHINQEDRKHE